MRYEARIANLRYSTPYSFRLRLPWKQCNIKKGGLSTAFDLSLGLRIT